MQQSIAMTSLAVTTKQFSGFDMQVASLHTVSYEWVMLSGTCMKSCKYVMQGKGAKGVKKFVDQKGLIQVSDPAEIEAIVDAVLAANQKQLEQYKAGKTKLQGHFVG